MSLFPTSSNDPNKSGNSTTTSEYENPDQMTANLVPDQQNQTNTTFMEQRGLNVQDAQMANDMTMSRVVDREMPDPDWYAKQQLMKPVLIKQYVWDTSNAVGSQIAAFDFPQILSTVDSLMTRTLSMYALFRMSPVFRFQVNSTQFHQGQLIASFDPFSQATDDRPSGTGVLDPRPLFSRAYATGLPNVKLLASESEPVELRVPFIHPRNYLTTNSSGLFEILGRIRITVLNQLRVATGSTPSLTVSVWLYAEDASVHIPIRYHTLELPTLIPTSLMGNATMAVGNVLTDVFKSAFTNGKGLISKTLSLDYPTSTVADRKTIQPVEPLSHGMGASRARRLALDPKSGHLDDEAFSPMSQDMDLLQIAQRPMLVDQLSWTTSASAGSLLSTRKVSPFQSFGTGSNGFQPSYLMYVSQAFMYWRGGITFDLEFVATRFHSGRLLIGFEPNAPGTTPTFAELSTSNPTVLVDLQQTSSVSFTVPYISPTPLKNVSRTLTSDTDDQIGVLYIMVQNTLAAASNVASSVDINVYARAASDFELYVPGGVNTTKYVWNTTSEEVDEEFTLMPTSDTGIKLQTNRMDRSSETANFSMGKSTISPRPRFGETFSMSDLLKRYSFVDLLEQPLGRDQNIIEIANSPIMSKQLNGDRRLLYNSYLAYFSRLYSIWSGSIRYKFVTNAPRSIESDLSVRFVPFTNDDALVLNKPTQYYNLISPSNSGLGQDFTVLSQDNCLEIELPFYSPFNFHVTYQSIGDADLTYWELPYNAGRLYVGGNDGQATGLIASYWVAAGDDFRLGYLRPPPTYYGLPY